MPTTTSRNEVFRQAGTSNKSSPSKASSSADGDGDSPAREESFIDALKSQVDGGNIEDIIQGQKKALERFEKTNEMLATCCTLAEKRLEKARKQFTDNKDQILEAKSDLDSIFRRIRIFKRVLAKEHPEEYAKEHAAQVALQSAANKQAQGQSSTSSSTAECPTGNKN